MSDEASALLRFEQHHLPGLEAGEYRVRIEQTLEMQDPQPGGGTKTKKVMAPAEAYFAVAGKRFQPLGAELVQVYPPENGVGEYERTFPHVVLSNPSMPWGRSPCRAQAPVAPGPANEEADVPTWLAVLLLDETDGVPLQPLTMQVKNLFDPPDAAGRACHSCFSVAAAPATSQQKQENELDIGEALGDPCLILDIPLQTFWRIAPSLNDLRVLAHVRLTSTAAKPTRGIAGPAPGAQAPKAGDDDATAAYAIVVGSRMPNTGCQSRAYLVSLENLATLLPNDDGSPPLTAGVAAADLVRLPCLASWAFTSTGSGRHFETLMGALAAVEKPGPAASPAPSGPVAHDYALRRPQPPAGDDSAADRAARAALRMGFVPMRHQTRDGGGTVSWYRGPLTPYRVGGCTPAQYDSADAATCYDPDTGLFDVSYAAAWQLGRLMALQAKSFSIALHNWRRGDARAVSAHLQGHAMAQSVAQANRHMPRLGALGSLLGAFAQAPDRPTTAQLPSLHQGYAVQAALHRDAMSDATAIAEAIDIQAVPDAVAAWLGALQLLGGVPFHYLVPDEHMLPPESLRFFAVDAHWVEALTDGACSIGRGGNAEAAHHEALQPALRAAAVAAAYRQRAAALGAPPAQQPDMAAAGTLPPLTGFLLRSSAVKFWPNLQANGYGPTNDGRSKDRAALDLLRFEHLADDLVIGIFAGETLGRLDLHEPPEGVHFGLDDAGETDSSFKIDLRVSADGQGAIGSVIIGSDGKPVPMPVRMRRGDVLRAWDLAIAIKDKARNLPAIATTSLEALPSSEFGMQMIKGVARARWDRGEAS